MRHLDTGDHGGHALGIVLGTVGKQRRVARDQFLGGFRASSQQDFAEPSSSIHLNNDIADLNLPNDGKHHFSATVNGGILNQGIDCRDVHQSAVVNFDFAGFYGFAQGLQTCLKVGIMNRPVF